MNTLRNLARRMAPALIAVFTLMTGLTATAQARIIATAETASAAAAPRDALRNQLARQEVGAQLQALGVDPAAVDDRLARLTDEEVAALSERIAQLPAGGDILGSLVFVFLVLLVTDILGYTKLFPFVKKTAR